MSNVEKLLGELRLEMRKILEENENLKAKVTELEIDNLDIADILTEEKIFLNVDKYKKLISNTVDKLSSNIKFKTKTKKPPAMLVSVMDSSASMGRWEKFMAKCITFWYGEILKACYENLEFVYITHHTEAKVVDVETFFTKGEIGGTIVSSGLRKANEIIEGSDYEYKDVFLLYLSDGDNLISDNARVIKLIENRLTKKCIFVNYIELNQYNRSSVLLNGFRQAKMNAYNFDKFIIRDKSYIYYTLKNLIFQLEELR